MRCRHCDEQFTGTDRVINFGAIRWNGGYVHEACLIDHVHEFIEPATWKETAITDGYANADDFEDEQKANEE